VEKSKNRRLVLLQQSNASGATYGKLYNWYAVMGITTEEDATPTQEQIGARKN
jgi:hypothetical protein